MDPQDNGRPPMAALVGIGMSAGGVDSLLPLLEALPPGLGLCCVLLQHLPAGHASMLAEILARRLGRPVRDLQDGDLPEADALWVAPSGRQPVFDGTRLRLVDEADSLQPRPNIDRFLSSLAQQLGPHAAGLILSGTGSDGAQGLRRIRLAGGLALVQSPDSARYVGMPEAAIRACDPQHVAPPAELARVLHGWPRRQAGRAAPAPAEEDPADEVAEASEASELAPWPPPGTEALRALATTLRQRCGIDLGHFKDSLLQRQLQRRCRACRCADLPEYLARIERDPSELDALAAALLVPVTAFWRDAGAFETLLAQCRERLAGRNGDEPLRAWVAGCATGEEAYSVAIVLLEALGEALGERSGRPALQVFATDLDTDALMQARRGRFSAAAMQDLPAELAQRWFECQGRFWEARPALRECLSFSRHDLTRDPPFARLDLVSCRHLLMYLRPSAQEVVLRQLAYALRPGGLLLLGRHEAVRGHTAQFHRTGGASELFERSQVPLPLPRDSSSAVAHRLANGERDGQGEAPRPPTPRRSAPRPDWRDLLLRQAAERYLPPAVLLGEQLEILQVQGDVTPFFALQGGLHRPHLLALARPGVAEVLRGLLTRPAAQRERHRPTLTTLVGRHQGRWRVEWQPCPGDEATPLSLLAFVRLGTRGQPVAPRGLLDSGSGSSGATEVGHESPGAPALQIELDAAQERLQRLGRQFEAVQRQARETSADAAAALAELQARFDALEARHEELQTANQELATVNAQLRLQAQTQQMQARDLLSIYQSIALPVLASDEQHAIHAYNAAAAQLLQLSPGSAGLPLSALRLPSGLPDLTACAEHALQSANPVLLELPPLDGGREFLVHAVRRAVEGEPRGAVLTFVERGLLPAAPQAAGLAGPGGRVESNWWAAMARSSALLAVKDLSGRYLFANAAYAAFFDLPVETLVGRTDMQCLALATARELRRLDLQALQDEPQARLEDLPGEGDGPARRWCCTRTVIRDRQGVSLAVAVQALDIGAQLQREQADHAAAGIFEVIGEGIALTDAAQKVARVNAAFTRLTGYDSEALAGRSPLALAVPDREGNGPPRDLLERLSGPGSQHSERAVASGPWQGEVWLRRRDGRDFPAWVSVSPVCAADGRTAHLVHTVSDISRLYETRESLRHLATHEPLTGLPNRALLIDRLGHALETARRRSSEVALCFIDLDHFKTINDSLGHDAGDEVIRLAADRIAENVRSADTLARLGGDEFVLLIENTNRHDCLQSVERISRALAETYLLRGNLLSTTASIGIAMYPGDGPDGATLMRHADAAMYRAKRAGRGRCEFFSAEVGDSARARLQLESGLRRALEQREFCLHYQPQVDVHSGRVVGLEALLRWQPPQGEAVAPTIFLPVAEETALIGHIGDWVLAEACAQLARWRDAGQATPRLSVNVSARQLRDRQFAERLQQLLVGHALPGRYLMLEITESALLQPNEGVLQVLQRLHAMGVKLSLDDFGTGYSSLASLRQLPLEELKIDRSFVQGALEQRDDREIVEAIIGLGRALGLHVVAEGVETASLWDYFHRQDGGVSLQGFHIAHPMDAQACTRWLNTRMPAPIPTVQTST